MLRKAGSIADAAPGRQGAPGFALRGGRRVRLRHARPGRGAGQAPRPSGFLRGPERRPCSASPPLPARPARGAFWRTPSAGCRSATCGPARSAISSTGATAPTTGTRWRPTATCSATGATARSSRSSTACSTSSSSCGRRWRGPRGSTSSRATARPGPTRGSAPSPEASPATRCTPIGMAADIRVPGIASEAVWRAAVDLRRGGVGLYRASDFVHIDVGPVRSWGFGERRALPPDGFGRRGAAARASRPFAPAASGEVLLPPERPDHLRRHGG